MLVKSTTCVPKKRRKWSKERREAQAKRCKAQAPSQASTGPKTAEGKRLVAQNAYKHGFYDTDTEQIKAFLRTQRHFIRALLGEK